MNYIRTAETLEPEYNDPALGVYYHLENDESAYIEIKMQKKATQYYFSGLVSIPNLLHILHWLHSGVDNVKKFYEMLNSGEIEVFPQEMLEYMQEENELFGDDDNFPRWIKDYNLCEDVEFPEFESKEIILSLPPKPTEKKYSRSDWGSMSGIGTEEFYNLYLKKNEKVSTK